MTAIIDEQKLGQIAEEYDLDLIVLFGSHATGRARPNSDYDLGVWFEYPDIHRAGWRYERETDIRRALWRLFPVDGPEPDIVFLNRADSILLRIIVETGKPLYVKTGASWPIFRCYANRRYRADARWRERTAAFLRRKYHAPDNNLPGHFGAKRLL